MYPPLPLRSTLVRLVSILLVYAIVLSFPIAVSAASRSTNDLSSNPKKKKEPQPSPGRAPVSDVAPSGRAVEHFANLPMSFEPNVGQADAETRFVSRGSGYALSLTSRGARFHVARPAADSTAKASRLRSGIADPSAQRDTDGFSMRFVGVTDAPKIEADEMLIGKTNYFIGNVAQNRRTDIPNYASVRYENIYPGIDLVFHGNQRQLEYDFIIGPGADLSVVSLQFSGARAICVDKQGDLVLTTGFGEIRHKQPTIYQESAGVRQSIVGSYILRGKQVGFRVGSYDRTKPLVVDPILLFSSYLGGSRDDFGQGVAVDPFDNIYIVGETSSPNYPTDHPFQSQNRGANNAFVTKINSAGTAVLYSTYLGGSHDDHGYAIAVESSGGVCITGGPGSIH